MSIFKSRVEQAREKAIRYHRGSIERITRRANRLEEDLVAYREMAEEAKSFSLSLDSETAEKAGKALRKRRKDLTEIERHRDQIAAIEKGAYVHPGDVSIPPDDLEKFRATGEVRTEPRPRQL